MIGRWTTPPRQVSLLALAAPTRAGRGDDSLTSKVAPAGPATRRLHLPRGPRNPEHRVHHLAQQASPAVQVELRRRRRARPLPRTPPPARTTDRPPRSRMTATLSHQDPVRNL